MIYFCCDERRRHLVREPASGLNGIDFLEVLDTDAPTEGERQRTLFVHFLKDLTSDQLTADNVLIEGGERIPNVAALPAGTKVGPRPNVLTV